MEPSACRPTLEQAAALGYDVPLQRLWEFYLCYCEGAYAEEYVSLQQVLATKPGGGS